MMVKITHKQNVPNTPKKDSALICPKNPKFLCNNPSCKNNSNKKN